MPLAVPDFVVFTVHTGRGLTVYKTHTKSPCFLIPSSAHIRSSSDSSSHPDTATPPANPHSMAKLSFLTVFVALALAGSGLAAIGPRADLVVTNAVISPDGFARDAVVVNGVHPAPLITGKKVRGSSFSSCSAHGSNCRSHQSSQGDRFKLNLIDKLTNHTMLKTTSIVSCARLSLPVVGG